MALHLYVHHQDLIILSEGWRERREFGEYIQYFPQHEGYDGKNLQVTILNKFSKYKDFFCTMAS